MTEYEGKMIDQMWSVLNDESDFQPVIDAWGELAEARDL